MEIFSKYILYVCIYKYINIHSHTHILCKQKTFILDAINHLTALFKTQFITIISIALYVTCKQRE